MGFRNQITHFCNKFITGGKGAWKLVRYKYKLAVSVIWFWINFVTEHQEISSGRRQRIFKRIQAGMLKENNDGHSGQLARTGKCTTLYNVALMRICK